MTFLKFLTDKVLLLILQIFGMIFLSMFLYVTGYDESRIVLLLFIWILVLVTYLMVEYVRRRKYFSYLERLLEELPKRYLIGEVMEPSHRLEDRLYREVIRRSNKSVIERIRQAERMQREYREYIEAWIHEVKGPITSLYLMSENYKDRLPSGFQSDVARIENYVDMALFYARSDEVYKDYFIRMVDLKQIVYGVIGKNKRYLIEQQMGITVDVDENEVPADDKWLEFILNQILLNAVKYKKEGTGQIHIYTEKGKDSVRLVVEDKGVGIRKNELGRIFDKGFTGSNGRREGEAIVREERQGNSTGIGLYLCRKLCEKLGMGIYGESEEGEYTRLILVFPRGNHHSTLQN